MANVSFSLPSELTPYASKVATYSNYLNFHGSGGSNWSQQYLPELYAQEVERYGNRSVSSFLRMIGAEMPMASDQVIWSEQGRLHLAYKATLNTETGAVSAPRDIDNEAGSAIAMSVRVGQTVVCQVTDGSAVVVVKGQITAAAALSLIHI